MLNKIIKEPLLHFLVAGFMLFVYFRFCSAGLGIKDSIVVNKKNVLQLLQFQSKAFNEEMFDARFAKLTDFEKEQLINQYIQEEVLFREAIKLGLDQNDYVLKKRVIQKMEFILDDFDATEVQVEEDSLQEYYDAHQDRYFQPALYSFTHIFFKNDNERSAMDRAVSFMKNQSHQKLSASDGLKHGDRFLYHRNYAEEDLSTLESQFGPEFPKTLTKIDAIQNEWQGPVRSIHGQHWIKLSSKTIARTPDLSEITDVVKSDYLNFLKKAHKERQIKKLIDSYNVQVKL